MKKVIAMLAIALTAALASAGCGDNHATKPALGSRNPKERRQAVDAAAEKFGGRKSTKATENTGDRR